MIDKHTGALVFDSGERIEPSVALDDWLASPLGAACVQQGKPGQVWRGCQLMHCVSQGYSFGVQLTFEGQRLFSAELGHENGPGPKSWDDFSMDKLRAVKAENDAFVTSWLGPPPWNFPWGSVASAIDERGGSAVLMIRYAIPLGTGAP
jgi:hypothetical protein